MRTTNALPVAVLFASAITLLGGCATSMHMKLAPQLTAVQPWDVRGHRGAGQAMQFGRWQVTTPASFFVDRQSVGGGDPLVLPKGPEVKVQSSTRLIRDRMTFQFELASQANSQLHWTADCVAELRLANRSVETFDKSDETEITQPGFPQLDCKFSGSQTGRLSIHADFSTQRDHGSAQFPQASWQLRSVSALEQGHTPWARFGHEFLRDDRVLGAVETIGDGRVWMHPDLTPVEEDEVALMSTALLYYGSLLELRDT